MRYKENLIKFFSFSGYEGEALRDYLEDMALDGWKLKEVTNVALIFEETDPQRLFYTVKLVNKGYTSGNDDWDYINQNRKIAVFVTSNENAEPIVKDQKQKYNNIFRNMIGSIFLISLMTLISCLWLTRYFYDFNGAVVSNLYIICSAYFIVLTLFILFDQLGRFFIWLVRAKQRLKKGEELNFYDKKYFIKRMKVSLALDAITVLLVIITIAILFQYSDYLSAAVSILFCVPPFLMRLFSIIKSLKKVFDRRKGILLNLIFGIMFCISVVLMIGVFAKFLATSELKVTPLSRQDFGITESTTENHVYGSKSESFLASTEYYTIYHNKGNFDYGVQRSNIPFITLKFKESDLDIENMIIRDSELYQVDFRNQFEETNDPAWGAKQVYVNQQDNYKDYIVVYQNCILTINYLSSPLTDSMKKNISNKLNYKS